MVKFNADKFDAKEFLEDLKAADNPPNTVWMCVANQQWRKFFTRFVDDQDTMTQDSDRLIALAFALDEGKTMQQFIEMTSPPLGIVNIEWSRETETVKQEWEQTGQDNVLKDQFVNDLTSNLEPAFEQFLDFVHAARSGEYDHYFPDELTDLQNKAADLPDDALDRAMAEPDGLDDLRRAARNLPEDAIDRATEQIELDPAAIKDINEKALKALDQGQQTPYAMTGDTLIIKHPKEESLNTYFNWASRQPGFVADATITMVKKGGVFDPGSIKVTGLPGGQKGAFETAIAGFSKKKVTY